MGIVSHAGAHASLGIRGIIGRYYRGYDVTLAELYAPKVGRLVPSDQEVEPYRFTGGVPRLQVQRGELTPREPEVYEFNIRNEPYEASMHFSRHDWRRDKTGQIAAKVAQMGMETGRHWDELLATLIEAGTTELAYDKTAYFASHTVGSRPDAPTFLNNVTSAQISSLNVASANNPSQTELVSIILGAVSHMSGAKDEFGAPVNGGAKSWYFMVPANMQGNTFGALRSQRISGAESNPLLVQNYGIDPLVNQWLTDDDVVYLFRKNSMMPAYFLQEEEAPFLEVFGPGSEYTAFNDKVLFVSKAVRSVGNGEFLYALRMQLS